VEEAGGVEEGRVEVDGVIEVSMLECSVCLQLLCEPVTTPCGHSFCRPCLVGTLRKNKKKCPSCRAICQIEPETHSETIALSSVAKAVFPKAYQVWASVSTVIGAVPATSSDWSQ